MPARSIAPRTPHPRDAPPAIRAGRLPEPPSCPFGWPADGDHSGADDLGERALAGLDILLVEDDPDVLSWLRDALVQAGADVVAAESILAARSSLSRRRVDVRVVDCVLGDGDGYLHLVLDTRPAHGVPVGRVCMSRYDAGADMQLALDELGAVVLTKPFTRSVLIRAVRRACQKAGIRGGSLLRFGAWTFDTERRLLRDARGARIRIGRRDAAVLDVLLQAAEGEHLDTWQLAERAWGRSRDSEAADNAVRQAITRLRRLIDDRHHEIIRHERGRGYWIAR